MQQSSVSLDLCLMKFPSGKSRDFRHVIVFEKLRFRNVFFFFVHSKPQSRRFVFVKIRFCDGLVCKFGRPNRLKLRYVLSLFQNTS